MPDYSLEFDKNKEYKMLIDRDVLAGNMCFQDAK